MINYKIKVIFLELLLIIISLLILLKYNNRIFLTIILSIFLILIKKILKKRKNISIYKKQIVFIMLIFSIVYLGIFYLLGFYFGFEKAKITFSYWTLYKFILPNIIIIVCSEIIRFIFLSQNIYKKIKKNKINISHILTYILQVIIDLIIYSGVYDFTNLNDFLTAIGFVLFASLSCNLLYNYISKNFGYKPIILYRIITIIYIYIIPVIPNIYIFFKSFMRMLYPYIMYLTINKIYNKNKKITKKNENKKSIFNNMILITIIILGIMLVSCKFTYGILVIGSNSMTGTINKGDAIIYKKFNNEKLYRNKIIVFNHNDIQTVHRIIEINKINGEYRYTTKGDFNKTIDDGYTKNQDIIGIVKLKIKYIGYPTLLLRKLFN